jgi:hypothetical protein
MDTSPHSDIASPEQPSRQPRESVFLLAHLQTSLPREPATLRVRNLSPGGLMADYSGALQKGDRIVVEMKGLGEISARVAWRTDVRIGIAFDVQVDPRNARIPIGRTTRTEVIVPPYLAAASGR